MTYLILTSDSRESARLQAEKWIPSVNLAPVTLLAMGVLRGHRGDLFYTDAALDALVASAGDESRAWQEWRVARQHVASVRPFEAWEYLNETTLEDLAERGRDHLALITSKSYVPAERESLSYLDLINFERRRCAAAVRSKAAELMLRIAPGRVIVTETQELGMVTVRASWTALAADARKTPDHLVNGLDTQSMAGVE